MPTAQPRLFHKRVLIGQHSAAVQRGAFSTLNSRGGRRPRHARSPRVPTSVRLLIMTIIAFFALWPSVEDIEDIFRHRIPASDFALAKSEPAAETPLSLSLIAAAQPRTSPMVEGGNDTSIAFDDPRIVSSEELCDALAEAAQSNGLPVAFFLRLIWQESRFIASAVSRAGAQGMAQFMPATAAERGLSDPFDPLQALPASARFLNALRLEFGNLGLAAAAYNAGSGRIRDWIEKRGKLPKETRDYVLQITGQAAENWVGGTPEKQQVRIPQRAPCRHILSDEEIAAADAPPVATPAPQATAPAQPVKVKTPAQGPKSWGVQLAGKWSKSKAVAALDGLRKKHPKILRSKGHDRWQATRRQRRGHEQGCDRNGNPRQRRAALLKAQGRRRRLCRAAQLITASLVGTLTPGFPTLI